MSRNRTATVEDVYPRLKDADGKPLCAWCRKPLPTARQKYCSGACQEQVYIRCMPDVARRHVARRDNGVCALCGCDTQKLRRILQATLRPVRPWRHVLSYDDQAWLLRQLGFNREGHLWEMDHIKPVTEGGGLCGLENLRTLCVPCHKRETAALRRRQAQARQDAARPLLGGGE